MNTVPPTEAATETAAALTALGWDADAMPDHRRMTGTVYVGADGNGAAWATVTCPDPGMGLGYGIARWGDAQVIRVATIAQVDIVLTGLRAKDENSNPTDYQS